MSQDYITYKQKIAAVPDAEILHKTTSDDNLMLIISALRKGPMTINDLVREFEKKGKKKSDKSIYRYLKELIEYKLVARAGKRIQSIDEKNIQSETIYIRTAKLFLGGSLKTKAKKLGEEKINKVIEVVKALLIEKYPDKITSSEGVQNILFKFDEEKQRLILDIFETASEDTLKKVSEIEWNLIDYMIEYAGWLALILELDIEKELEKCCPE